MPILVLVSAFLEGLSLTLVQGYLPLFKRRSFTETTYLTVGAVIAIPALGTFIASNFWGGLSDVSGRLKPFILIGLAGYALALAGYPLLHNSLGIFLWAGAISLFYGTLSPTLKTYVTLAKPGWREHALAYLLMCQSIGWFAGSVGGSRLMEHGVGVGFRLALGVAAALLAAQTLLVAFFLRDQSRPPIARQARPWLAGVAEDLKSLYENPKLLGLCATVFFLVTGNYMTWGFFTVYFVEHLHASVHTLGIALGASALLGILLMPAVGPLIRRLGGHVTLAIGTTLYLVMYLGMAVSKNPIAAAALFALPLYGTINVSANVLASQYSAQAQRGGGLGVLSGTYALATIVGPLLGGGLADRFGLGVIPWSSLSFAVVATLMAWRAAVTEKHLAPQDPGRNGD